MAIHTYSHHFVLSILPAIFHLQSLRSVSFLGSPHFCHQFLQSEAWKECTCQQAIFSWIMVKRWIHGCFGSRRCSNLRELDAANRLMSAALNFQIQTVRQCRKSRKIEATKSRTKNWAFRSFFSFLSFLSLHAPALIYAVNAFSYQLGNDVCWLGHNRFETQTSQKCPSPQKKRRLEDLNQSFLRSTFLSTFTLRCWCFITTPINQTF